MKSETSAVVAAILLTACGSGSQSAAQSKSAVVAAKKLDIAGVGLGMPIAEVQAALTKGGWKIETEKGDNWSEAVERAADQRAGRITSGYKPQTGIGSLNATKGEEQLFVGFHPTPSGSQVSQVGYRAPKAGRSFEEIRSELRQRYGKPTSEPSPGMLGDITWSPQGRGGPSLNYYFESSGVRLQLSETFATLNAWQKSVNRAVNAKMGDVGKSF